jgi:hypothetical protein
MDLPTCLRLHKAGTYYEMWAHEDGQPNHYRMYCFACDKERVFWIRPRDVVPMLDASQGVVLTQRDHPGRGST